MPPATGLRSAPITTTAAGPGPNSLDEGVDVDALEQAADDPDDGGERRQRRRGGVRVRRLRVVDPGDAVRLATSSVRWWSARNARTARWIAAGRTVPARARAAAASTFIVMCGLASPAASRSSCVASSSALLRRSSTKARSHRTSSTIPTSPGRDAGREPDGTAALDHVGFLDHVAGRLVGDVVDAGQHGALVHLGLGRAVGLGGAVPLEVVVGDVEADGGQRHDRAVTGGRHVVQLVAGELDDEDVEALGVADDVEDGHADVAAGHGTQAPSWYIAVVSCVVVVLPFVPGDRHPRGGDRAADDLYSVRKR